jgi:hypothetical protein
MGAILHLRPSLPLLPLLSSLQPARAAGQSPGGAGGGSLTFPACGWRGRGPVPCDGSAPRVSKVRLWPCGDDAPTLQAGGKGKRQAARWGGFGQARSAKIWALWGSSGSGPGRPVLPCAPRALLTMVRLRCAGASSNGDRPVAAWQRALRARSGTSRIFLGLYWSSGPGQTQLGLVCLRQHPVDYRLWWWRKFPPAR